MSTQVDAPEIKPEVVFVYDLVLEILRGQVRIPGFQRPFVWRRDQMRDLLESVDRQYPIGSILLWEPSETYRTLDWVGLHKMPEPTGSVALILDGQQRLSTLAGALAPKNQGAPNPEDDDPERWEIWFNATNDQFEHLLPNGKVEPHHFPLRKLMETVPFIRECDRMLKADTEKGPDWVSRVERLAKAFQRYKVPVIRIKSTALDQAVEAFARLNSRGQKMSQDELLSALVYRESQHGAFDLARHIDAIHGDLVRLDFGEVDRTTILRAVLACLGEDVYHTDWTRITKDKRPDIETKLERDAERVRAAVRGAIGFLQGCGVHHERLLPYAMQLVVLVGFFFSRPEPTGAQKRFLRRWFWVSSFTGWGGVGNPSRVGAVVEEFASRIAKEDNPTALTNMALDQPALPFPARFDMRSARVRAWLLVLLAQEPLDPTTSNPIDEPWSRIGSYGPDAIGYVVSRMKGREMVSSLDFHTGRSPNRRGASALI